MKKKINTTFCRDSSSFSFEGTFVYSIWNKEQENEIHLTKLDLALQMLQALNNSLFLYVYV